MQYLLCGLPFSGKTTLGKKLQEKLGFVHLNLDKIKAENGYGKISDDDVPEKVWESIFTEANKKLIECLKNNKNAANETAWVTRKWRDKSKKVAANAGFTTKIIFLDIPERICRQRWQENKKTKTRYDTYEAEFESYVHDFEKPTEDENVLLYDGKIPLDDWVKKNF